MPNNVPSRNCDVWVTREGVRLRPEDMDHCHRVNTMHLCLRRTQAKLLNAAIWLADLSKLPVEVTDEMFEDAYDPDTVWAEVVDTWPVLARIRELVEKDPAFDDLWTPTDSHPWYPVMRDASGGVVVSQRWKERTTQ